MKLREQTNILIITPSLNPQDNISGISTVSKLLIKENKKHHYIPFIVGKKDKEKRGLLWLMSFVFRPFRLLFVRNRQIDLVHFNISFEPKSLIRDIILFMALLIRSIPVVLHIHGGRFMNQKAGAFKSIIGVLLLKSKQIIVLSDIEKSFLQETYPEIEKGKIHIVPNAISLPELKLEDKNFESKMTILYLGRIDRAKGLEKIAVSLNSLTKKGVDFIFYLCGVGPDKKWFLSQFKKETMDNLSDMGLILGEDKAQILKQSHIYLLPSDYEGLPLSLLESMSNFVVPIVTPVGSIPEVVNTENGRIINSENQIVANLKELDSNRVLLKKIAENARLTIEKGYSITQFIAKINAIYETVIFPDCESH
ncbi:glycosyltransferase family 4 protein [Parabacteroides sp. OttesenSCG-928-G07]|nr:glycosyltransferase family 4 protein [Parabacteroides sp. OttesenSCG-928-G07]